MIEHEVVSLQKIYVILNEQNLRLYTNQLGPFYIVDLSKRICSPYDLTAKECTLRETVRT